MKKSLEIRYDHAPIPEVDKVICNGLGALGYKLWAQDQNCDDSKPDTHLAFHFPAVPA